MIRNILESTHFWISDIENQNGVYIGWSECLIWSASILQPKFCWFSLDVSGSISHYIASHLINCPSDDLCIVIWISVFIIQVTEKYSTAMCYLSPARNVHGVHGVPNVHGVFSPRWSLYCAGWQWQPVGNSRRRVASILLTRAEWGTRRRRRRRRRCKRRRPRRGGCREEGGCHLAALTHWPPYLHSKIRQCIKHMKWVIFGKSIIKVKGSCIFSSPMVENCQSLILTAFVGQTVTWSSVWECGPIF